MSRKVPKRRRREKKTDYKQRLGLLKSRLPRLVVRKSSNNTITQLIDWDRKGDNVLVQVDAKKIREHGWKGHTGNIPSAYLAGYMLGKMASEKGIDRCVLDIGLQENTKENRIYAAVEGARNAGLQIPVGDNMAPSEDRIKGKHIENYASIMDAEKKKKMFSKMIGRGLDPENISENFEETKKNIEEEF